MPWDTIKLNDGNSIPGIGFGTWKIPKGHETTDEVDQAISVGFSHIDTAQIYRNEEETGKAIRESGLKREEIFITTKYSGMDMLDIETSIKDSLSKLGVSYIDLYLIHHPRVARPDITTAWSEMEALKSAGLVKSIGVSNFGVKELETLLDKAKIKPAVNQIMLQPYVYAEQAPTIDFCNKHGIIVEGYSPLIPVTQLPNGPVTRPLKGAAKRLKATEDQVLLAWARAKGAVILTSSSKKSRLEGYLAAGDLALSEDEIKAIDKAGAKGQRRHYIMKRVKSALPLVCASVVAVALLNHYFACV
ncbi:Aldo/keto reductase [Crepidotus variabilis]|uniref:Aldo/keto reductase n=1 Tax=Crepidotus variabilis TaxID=179855 RepID=A0A9P6E9H0_9AGAR|nr:Aldo/keto reductase [Crepidotus variabilis]